MTSAPSHVASEVLKDGTAVTIRAIEKSDRESVLAVFGDLDPESIYTRFFTCKSSLTETELSALTEVDPDRTVALVASVASEAGEKLVGGGRYICDASHRTAELAFVTSTHYRGRGIAGIILKHLVQIGRERGIRIFEADVLAQNPAMLAAFRGSGLEMKTLSNGNVVHVTIFPPLT